MICDCFSVRQNAQENASVYFSEWDQPQTRHMHTLNLKSVADNPEPDSNFLIKKSSINSLALCDYNKWPWFLGLPTGCSYNTPTTATRSHCPKLTEATKSNQKLAKVTHKGSNKCKCQWRWPVMLVIALVIFFSLQLSVPLEFWWNKKWGLLYWGSTELLKYE